MKLFALLLMIMPFLFGGVITGNILGDMKQKTGEIVFYLWKGIQVFRKKVIPSNPKTVAQTSQRTLFSDVLFVGQDLLLPVLKVFWKPLAIKMSEMNAFLKYNLLNQSGSFSASKLILALGSIPFTSISAANYSNGSGVVSIGYSPSAGAGQETSDKMYGAVYNPTSKLWYFNLTGEKTRADGDIGVSLPSGLPEIEAESCLAFIWCTDKAVTVAGFKVSDSSHSLITFV